MKEIGPNVSVQKGIIIVLVVCLLMVVPALAMTGALYELTWSTIDGGGARKVHRVIY